MWHPDTAHAQAPDAAGELAAARSAIARLREELATCRASLQRNQSALCAIADGIVVTDCSGRITCLNPVAAHLSGWSEDECLGRPMGEVLEFIDSRGRAHDVIGDGFSWGQHDDVVSLVRRDGHSILIDGAVAPIKDRDEAHLGFIVTFRNITAATRISRELAYHANHDPLTGLLNRRALDARLQRAVDTAGQGARHALLYFDLDRFKAVNDTAGHVAGDELLRQLAAMLRGHLRDRDTLARVGGDEFVVLLEHCSAEQAARVAEKIRAAVEHFRFEWDAKTFPVGASVGQLEFDDDTRPAAELIKLADRLCYVAKVGGRNRVAFHRLHDPGIADCEADVSHREGSRRQDGPAGGRSEAA